MAGYMYLRDDRVYARWQHPGHPERDDGLVVSRHDLAGEVGYINANGIEHLDIQTGNPRIFVDLAPLHHCPQVSSLVLSGNLTNSEVLNRLPRLRTLSIDNTLGKKAVDLSALTLLIQRPGRNVRGFEQISSLRELVLWNYQPKSRDLSALHRLTSLTTLRLIQPRINTLDGLEQLPALETLENAIHGL